VTDDDEWRKRITSLMRDGTTVVTIDNVQHRLERSEWQGFLLAWQARYGSTPTLLAKVAGDVLGDEPVCRTLRDALPGPLADAATGQGSFTRRLVILVRPNRSVAIEIPVKETHTACAQRLFITVTRSGDETVQ
jgi:hypothetical protein